MFKHTLMFTAAAMAAFNAPAQAQICTGVVPIQPTTLCANRQAPLCVCDQFGLSCKWIWVCTGNSSRPSMNTDVAQPIELPPLTPPQSKSPMEFMIEQEQLRQLRLENQRRAQQLRNERKDREEAKKSKGNAPQAKQEPEK